MIDLGTLAVKLKVDGQGEAEKGLQSFGSKVEGLAKNGLKVMGASALAAGAALTGIAVASTKMAMDFETSFAKVSTLLDANTTDFEAYKKSILNASKETGVAVDEFSEAVYGSISAGVDSTKAIEFTTDAMKLAKGGFTDGAKAVDVLTTALNGYKLGAEETGRVSDLLITTQNLGKTTVDELASSMGKVIPIASAGNFSIEELSASYATLTKNGIATAESGTYLKGMLGELTKSGSQTDKALKELTGQGFAQLKESGMATTDILKMLSDKAEDSGKSLKDMFGSSEAGTAAMVLMSEGGKEYNEILGQMATSAGATDDAFKKMNDTPQAMFEKLINNAKIVGIELGMKLLPLFNTLMEWVIEHMPQIQAFIEKAFNIIGEVISVATEYIGIFIDWMKNLLDSNTESGQRISKIWETVKETFKIVFETISEFISAFIEMAVAFWDAFGEDIMKYTKELVEFLGAVFKTVFDLIGDIFKIFTALFKGDWEGFWKAIGNLFSNYWNNIKNVFKQFIDIIIVLLNAFGKLLSTVWNAIWNGIKTALEYIWNGIVSWFSGAINGIVNIVTGIQTAMQNAGKAIFGGLWDGIKGVWTAISSWVGEKVAWLADKLSFWKKSNSEMKTDGSHRNGLNEVPYDGYIAELHKGERVLTANETSRYENGGSGGGSKTITNNVTPVFNIYTTGNNPKDISRQIQKDLSLYNLAMG